MEAQNALDPCDSHCTVPIDGARGYSRENEQHQENPADRVPHVALCLANAAALSRRLFYMLPLRLFAENLVVQLSPSRVGLEPDESRIKAVYLVLAAVGQLW